MENIKNKDEKTCYGCSACKQICPQKCIDMVENERGFLIPIIDEKKCTKCGVCKIVCDNVNNESGNKVRKCFMAIINDKNILRNSTSGGIFSTFANYVLENNGAVYGCSWESLEAKHIRVQSEKELFKIRKSKYIQSDINNSFIRAKKDLLDNKMVLFSGTGCQISGLLAYLGRNYDNLITIEVACHGVPSPGLFREYIKYMEKKEKRKILNFEFRNKVKHKTGEHYMFEIMYDDGIKKYFYANEDPYYNSFLEGKILRKTCYNCKFKGNLRKSDITLSDFWGVEKVDRRFPAYNGVSAIIINTTKGEDLYNKINNTIKCKEIEFDDVVLENKSLIQGPKYELVVEYRLDDSGLFEKLSPNKSLKKFLKNKMPGNLKYFLKRMKWESLWRKF